ncbi:Protein of unknown function [Pyronema omphalodes CBS 100304]|uniref:Uncharacterized protein n=1 Tax=Pyronema omphalodes (strain CBS 100304) TaxID=1076935 RepID=U4L2T9_PYROM|nr:Protein of unknown function [Pyronema omphalodes CBS 100304]
MISTNFKVPRAKLSFVDRIRIETIFSPGNSPYMQVTCSDKGTHLKVFLHDLTAHDLKKRAVVDAVLTQRFEKLPIDRVLTAAYRRASFASWMPTHYPQAVLACKMRTVQASQQTACRLWGPVSHFLLDRDNINGLLLEPNVYPLWGYHDHLGYSQRQIFLELLKTL